MKKALLLLFFLCFGLFESSASTDSPEKEQTTQDIILNNLFNHINRSISPEIKAYLYYPAKTIEVETMSGPASMYISIMDSTGTVVEQVFSYGSSSIDFPAAKGQYTIIIEADSYYGVGRFCIE